MLGLLLWREQFVGSFHLLQCTVLWLLKLSWGGIRLDPQLSSSALLFDFGSMNSLRGGCPQKFLFIFFLVCIVFPNGQNPCLFRRSLNKVCSCFYQTSLPRALEGDAPFPRHPSYARLFHISGFNAHAHCSCFDNSSSLPPPPSSRLESWEPPWPGACDTRDMNEQTHFQQFFYCTLNVLQVHNCGAIRLDPIGKFFVCAILPRGNDQGLQQQQVLLRSFLFCL